MSQCLFADGCFLKMISVAPAEEEDEFNTRYISQTLRLLEHSH